MIFGITLGIEAIIYALAWYLFQPAVNLESAGFWGMVIFGLALIMFAAIFSAESVDFCEKIAAISGVLAGIALVLLILIALFNTALFRANSYAKLYGKENIETVDISEYFARLDNIPLTDSDTANKLAIRKMGSLKGDMVSQFEAADSYVSTYNGVSYRIAPLKYAGFSQWLSNKESGIPAYITVNMTTQETEIVYLEKEMKYSPSEYFSRDLLRHIRKDFPSSILGDSVFEIDEDGMPYWITPVIDHTIGLFSGDTVKGVVVTNAISGENEYYKVDNVPEWIDNVYPTDMLISQYDSYGKYQDGFWNSVFAKKNAVATTEGYNYIPDSMDVNIYTGVTSLVTDESNVGFVLINKRTKQTYYYEYPGAEEFSAMSSAEGLVQQYGYTATFPLLVNVENEPTYYLALKDAGGLVKAYALINVRDYQNAVSASTLEETVDKYLVMMGKKSSTSTIPSHEETEKSFTVEVNGIIESIKTGDIDGNTYFYVKLSDSDVRYRIALKDSESIMLLDVGSSISLIAENSSEKIISAKIN